MLKWQEGIWAELWMGRLLSVRSYHIIFLESCQGTMLSPFLYHLLPSLQIASVIFMIVINIIIAYFNYWIYELVSENKTGKGI